MMKNFGQKKVNFFKIVFSILFILNLICISASVYALEQYPNKEVKMIVPFGPGGGADVNSRAVQPHLEERLGVPVVIENKAGGAGTVGYLAGARAPADGYTILAVTPSVIITQYTTDVGMDYKKYEPIIQSAYAPGGIIVKADSQWNTIDEFLDYARENPGMITMSNTGPGALWHTVAVAIEEATGVEFTHVPYNSGAEAATAVAGGHVNATAVTMAECSQLVKSGMIKALAVTSPTRYKFAPDVPTFKEKGYDLDLGVWWGFVLPKGVEMNKVDTLYQAFKNSVETEEFQAFLDERWIMYREMSPEDFQDFLNKEDERWGKLIAKVSG